MVDDTTAPSYWLNWRFLLCAIWILVAMVFAALLIWRHEGRRESRDCSNGDQQEPAGCLYDDEVWGTCSKSIHPIWLLAYRIVAFSVLLALLLADLVISGAGKFYFYTEWTFTLVTIYFGLGSSLSFHGSLHLCHDVELDRDNSISSNAERGSYVPPQLGEDADMPSQTGSSNCYGEPNFRTAASVWGYVFQIVIQMSAGAVMLTDSVFWLILYPSLIANAFQLSFLIICKHSINAIPLLGDVILNHLRFPFFRVAYLFYGRVHSSFSSGSVMLVHQLGGLILFWTCHLHMLSSVVLRYRPYGFDLLRNLYHHIQSKAAFLIEINFAMPSDLLECELTLTIINNLRLHFWLRIGPLHLFPNLDSDDEIYVDFTNCKSSPRLASCYTFVLLPPGNLHMGAASALY